MEPNPSYCDEFRHLYPRLFAPLQTETFSGVREGRSLALIAPTSSGKTLAVAAPLFESKRKAVFVYPFRALALDQINQLVRYAEPFGISMKDFAIIMGGKPERELAKAVEKDYILMTPDKLVSLFLGGRTPKGAALTILTSYAFVFDEVHAYNSLMRSSLVYFIRSVKYWREGVGGAFPLFYFLSATFPEDLWSVLRQELGMSYDDSIQGVSNTGEVRLFIRPYKENANEIAAEMDNLGLSANVVAIFNTAMKAWRVSNALWGRELAPKRLFVGQDKMSDKERINNFQNFISNPAKGGLCGSPAIEAGVDFPAAHLVIEETYADSFLQRFGRAARSGKSATVLCYSNTLYALQQKGELKAVYSRKDFLDLVGEAITVKEPRKLFARLAGYPYYKFWDGPGFFESDVQAFFCKLDENKVDNLLAFRGFIPYARYQTGESITLRALFKKDLLMTDGKVAGSPGLERYFFAKRREQPINAYLKQIVKESAEKVDAYTTVFLAKVAFNGFGTYWVILEYKSSEYERIHPFEEDDNICLRGFPGGEIGRTSGNSRNGILRFFEVDA